jgi:hypothetical protein
MNPVSTLTANFISTDTHFNIIPHLRISLSNGLFFSDIPTEIVYESLVSLIRPAWPSCPILLDLIALMLSGEKNI